MKPFGLYTVYLPRSRVSAVRKATQVPRQEAQFWANVGCEPESVDRPSCYLGADQYVLSLIAKALKIESKEGKQ